MTDWATIETRYVRLREFVLNDLEGFGANKDGGNFALVALVLAGCDALGTLRYGGRSQGWRVFQRCLPDTWKPVARILYDALRNGLIHGYDAQLVVAKCGNVSFEIGWYPAYQDLHMKFVTGQRAALYIDAHSLVASLRIAFGEIEAELRADKMRWDKFLKYDRKDRVRVVSEQEEASWRTAVSLAEIAYKVGPVGTPGFPGASPSHLAGATGAMAPRSPEEGTT